jgi:hypothetical protein
MKMILVLCGALLAGLIAWLLIAHPCGDHFGSPFQGRASVELGQLLDRPSDYLKKEVRIEGVLTRQCLQCGCWFFLKGAGGRELRVEMGDTAGHLPFRLGKKATVEGQLIRFGDSFEFIGNAVEFH